MHTAPQGECSPTEEKEDLMIRNSNEVIESATQDVPAAPAPAFAPVVSAAPVTEATRGRQTFNDSDKDNYFEG